MTGDYEVEEFDASPTLDMRAFTAQTITHRHNRTTEWYTLYTRDDGTQHSEVSRHNVDRVTVSTFTTEDGTTSVTIHAGTLQVTLWGITLTDLANAVADRPATRFGLPPQGVAS